MAESAGDIFGPIDAETGDTSQWSSTVVDDGLTFDAHADAKNNGTYGFRCLASKSGNDSRGIKTFANQTDLYVRFYVYLTTCDQIANYEYDYIFKLIDGTTSLLEIAPRCVGAGGNFTEWRVFGQDLTSASSSTNFSTGAWHRVEIHWLAGSGADGGAVVWIDGTSIFSELNNNLTAYAADSISLGHHSWIDAETSLIYYFDDIKGNTTGPIGAYSEAGGGRTALITRAKPLGVAAGMNFGVQY